MIRFTLIRSQVKHSDINKGVGVGVEFSLGLQTGARWHSDVVPLANRDRLDPGHTFDRFASGAGPAVFEPAEPQRRVYLL